MEDTVKLFNRMKNYSFITPDEGEEDLFVQASDIESGSLSKDDRVDFDSEQDEKGPRTVKVKKLN